MTQSNSSSLDSFQKVQRILFSSNVSPNSTSTLERTLLQYLPDLTEEEILHILDKTINVFKLRTAAAVLAVVALKLNKLSNPLVVFNDVVTTPKILLTVYTVYSNLNGGNLRPLANSLKKVARNKLNEFSDYSLIRGNTNSLGVTLAHILCLTHPKATTPERELLFKQILENNTPTLDTWQTALSGATTNVEKQMHWERLLLDGKLSPLEVIRNVNNFIRYNVTPEFIHKAISEINVERVGLYPLYVAYQHIKTTVYGKDVLELLNNYRQEIIKGNTLIILDISGSMSCPIYREGSASIMSRQDLANLLAYSLLRTTEQSMLVLTAGSDGMRQGKHKVIKDAETMSIQDIAYEVEIGHRQIGQGGIFTRQCLEWCQGNIQAEFDRIVVISDSTDCDHSTKRKAKPFTKHSYLLDISQNTDNIIFDSDWSLEINGWSENLPEFICNFETI